jgi:tetratricopeptide (TPR) repeat protein
MSHTAWRHLLNPFRLEFLGSVLLVAAIWIVYFPVLQFDFVNFDDDEYVVYNTHVHDGLTLDSVEWAFTTLYCGYWQPLTWLSFMIDHAIFGLNPHGFHFTNVLLHSVNAVLVFHVFRRLTDRRWESAFVAAMFAIHPLHVESVAWVVERKDVLSTMFWLLTMAGYLRYTRHPRPSRYLLALSAFALGLMAKPMLVTLPGVLLLLDYWPLSRLTTRAWLEKIPMVVLAVVFGVVTLVAQHDAGAVMPLGRISWDDRLGNAVVAYVSYIAKMFWPAGLAIFYPHPRDTLPAWQVAGSAILLATATAVVIRFARSRRYLLVGWLWYLGTMLPVIGITQAGSQAMADRFAYVPLIGIYLLVACALSDMSAGWRHQRMLVGVSAIALQVALMRCTAVQVTYWRDSVTVFERAIRVTTDNYLAHTNLAAALINQGKTDEAVMHLHKALEIHPRFAVAHRLMGTVLMERGEFGRATAHFSQAVGMQDTLAEVIRRKGNDAVRAGRPAEAVRFYEEALEINADFAEAHRDLADVLVSQGRVDEAVEHYTRAVAINPNLPEIRRKLQDAIANKTHGAEQR